MNAVRVFLALAFCASSWVAADMAAAAESAPLPAAASHQVDFHREILPILANRCATCHGSGRAEGGFSVETRSALLTPSDSGQAVHLGQSADSLLIQLVARIDPDWVMPKQGKHLSAAEVGLLRAWIDQGAPWEEGITLRKLSMQSWKPRPVTLPSEAATGQVHPVDRLLAPYFQAQGSEAFEIVDDRTFARRVYYDLGGLPPTPAELRTFLEDTAADKRAQLVRTLLDDRPRYAQHWLTFWNDLLRNDYEGPGYIDGGRRQITTWLYQALLDNKPLDEFVRELVEPAPGAEGFTQGIIWRGAVNASQRPPLQAAQNLAQVFLGVNLKCASCHDSFISQWKLQDAYALAGVFADQPLELFECDTATGEFAEPQFLNTELGLLSTNASRAERQRELAALVIQPDNARLRRTIVNRLWARFFGRGLIEPIDEIDNPAWHDDLLEWLAADLQAHDDDLKHTMQRLLTSQAYQRASVSHNPDETQAFVFRGPLVKRLTAEQFTDTIWMLTGTGPQKPRAAIGSDGREHGFVRAALVSADPLMRALGRPSREQVVTSRPDSLTTLEALDLTNGPHLASLLARGAEHLLKQHPDWDTGAAITFVYENFLSRPPTAAERELAQQVLGSQPTPEGLSDLLWLVLMLPEFQFIR